MPRIVKVDLNQINLQIDKIDNLIKRVGELESSIGNLGVQTAALDYLHAPPTTNNLTFTWTGATTTLSWLAGYIQDKNASAQNPISSNISSAKGPVHTQA